MASYSLWKLYETYSFHKLYDTEEVIYCIVTKQRARICTCRSEFLFFTNKPYCELPLGLPLFFFLYLSLLPSFSLCLVFSAQFEKCILRLPCKMLSGWFFKKTVLFFSLTSQNNLLFNLNYSITFLFYITITLKVLIYLNWKYANCHRQY